MPDFVVISKATGQEAYRYSADEPHEFVGFEFESHDHVELPAELPAEPAPLPLIVWTPTGFLRRLTQDERIAARDLAKTDARAADFLHLLDRAEEVRSDDPDTLAGLAYLTACGVLGDGRMAVILGGA